MLLTSLHGHKLQFIFHKSRPLSSSHGQLRELVFFPCTEALTFFLERHTRLFVEPTISALLFAGLMTTLLLQSLNKICLKYVFHEYFQNDNAYFMNQKTLSLNFKSSRLQMFFRSSHPEMFCKKAVLRDFPKFTRKHLCQSLFITKVAGQGWQIYLKKRPCFLLFPVNFAKFGRKTFLMEHL